MSTAKTTMSGRVVTRFDPQPEQRSRSATSGTGRSAGRASQFTRASWRHASHAAITLRTPFWRMLARSMGGLSRPSAS
jgi:hypothetical protein